MQRPLQLGAMHAWSPDGCVIGASGSMDKDVRLWDPNTGQAVGGAMKDTKHITALAWEPAHVAYPPVRLASASWARHCAHLEHSAS